MSEAAFVDQNREGQGWTRPYTPDCGDQAAGNFCSSYPFSLGNLRRETEAITGPIYLAEDVSVIKDFRIKGRVAFQLKVQADFAMLMLRNFNGIQRMPLGTTRPD